MKYAAWGPKKSGLYAEDEVGLYYTDKDYENAVVNGGDTQVLYDYGYQSFPVITHFIGLYSEQTNKYAPGIEYKKRDKERVASEYNSYMNFGFVDPLPELPFMQRKWHIYNMTSDVEGVKKMWNARTSVEDALLKVLASGSDEEFEKNYADVISIEERNGYNDECFIEINEWLEEQNGKDAVNELVNWDWETK